MYNAYRLRQMQYPGSSKLREFYNKWIEMLAEMKQSDMPSKESLRDILFRKLDNKTSVVRLDLSTSDNVDDADPNKNLAHLTNMMKRHIDKGHEKMLLQQREKAMSSFTNFDKRAAAAEQREPKAKARQSKPKSEPKNREATPAPARNRDKTPDPHAAASVLPSPNPKRRAKGRGKGKKGNGRDKTRSPSSDKKDTNNMACVFHFEKNGCRKGKDGQYGHSKSVYDASKSRKNSRSKSPGKGGKGARGRSGTPAPGSSIQSGNCPHGDKCMFQHVRASSPATSNSTQKATPVVVDDFFMSDSEDRDACISAAAGRKQPNHVGFAKTKPVIVRYECSNIADGVPVSQTQNGKG